MPDKYQILLGIENNQADTAARASLKLMQQYERQCLAAARAAQAVFQTAGSAVGGPGGGSAVMPAAVAARMRGSLNGPSQAARKAAEPKIDVGLHKLQIDALNANEARATAARKQADKDATEYDKIQDRKAKSDDRAADRKAKSDERASERSRKQAEKDAKEYDRIQDRKVKSDDKAADQAVKIAEREAKAKERLEAGPAAKRASFRRKDLTEEQVHANALNAITDVSNKRRIEARAKQMGEQRLSFAEAINSALNLESAFGKVAIAGAAIGLGMTAITGIIGGLSDGYDKIRKDAEAAAEAVMAMRDAAREEAVLRGATSADTASLTRALKFRVATGLGETEATELTKYYLGSLPVALQKGNITEKIASDLMVQVGINQARLGGPAGTRGDLGGIIGQFGKITSVEQGLGQIEAIRMGLTEGRGEDATLTNQLLKVAGAIVKEGGIVKSLPELAAVIGVTSLSAGPEAAGTRAEQLNRGFIEGFTKHGKVKGTVSSQFDYFKLLKISEKDTLEPYLAKIIPDIKKAQKEGRNVDVYLADRGFRGEETRRALIESAENYDVLRIRMEKSRAAQDGAAQLKANKEYLESAAGRQKVAEQVGAVETAVSGLPGERMRARKTLATKGPEISEGDKSIITNTIGDFFLGLMAGRFPFTGGGTVAAGREERIRTAAFTKMEEQALKANISRAELDLARSKSYSATDPDAAYTNAVEAMLERKGVSMAVDPAESLKRLDKAAAASEAVSAPKAVVLPAAGVGPQASAGGIPGMGIHTLLAMSAVGAIGGRERARVAMMTPGELSERAWSSGPPMTPGELGERAWTGKTKGRFSPDMEKYVTGNIHLPTDPTELARIKGLGVRKPVSDAERDRISHLGAHKPQSAADQAIVQHLKDLIEVNRKTAATNAAMLKQEMARKATQAPPTQPVTGPAQLAGR